MSDRFRQEREHGEASGREQNREITSNVVEANREKSWRMPSLPRDAGSERPDPKVGNCNNKDRSSFKRFGGVSIAVFIIFMMVWFMLPSKSVDTSEAAVKALNDRTSSSLLAGAVLLQKDENIGQQDYTITHQSQVPDTKIWVWDYAAEDGDYVQVLVNGTPAGDAFMIKHKPRELNVPAIGEVQVKGIKDGGGGITYAIRYDVNGTNYFNSAPQGEFNTYTLQKE